jgi:hypothetical protein
LFNLTGGFVNGGHVALAIKRVNGHVATATHVIPPYAGGHGSRARVSDKTAPRAPWLTSWALPS